eukprot:Gb_11229 [translate_table: standard]
MGVAIRRPRKSRRIFHQCTHKPNRDFVVPKQSKKMQSLSLDKDTTERPPKSEKGEFLPWNLDADLLFEVFKHMDARSLARASCVNRFWHRAAQDEKLWENICTRHWINTGRGNQQLRSVVLALGGFRRLYSLCLWPLLNSSSSFPSFNPRAFSPFISSHTPNRKHAKAQCWGKDEIHLSLSLFSIHCYEKMSSAQMRNSSGIHVPASKHPIFED